MSNHTSTIDVAELLHELGDIDEDRIVWDIEPGTATIDDMQDDAFPMCELIDGTIVRKAMGKEESIFTMWLGGYFTTYLRTHPIGHISGPDALVQLFPKTARAADIAFTSRLQYIDGVREKSAVATIVPVFMVEVHSLSNRAGAIRRKRIEYFQAGVLLVWEIDPRRHTIEVFTAIDETVTLTTNDTIDAGSIMPGFTIELLELFSSYDGL